MVAAVAATKEVEVKVTKAAVEPVVKSPTLKAVLAAEAVVMVADQNALHMQLLLCTQAQ